MVHGPIDYVPSIEVEVVTRRKTIPLDKNEGIYVRNTKTGKVKTVIGEPYMLNEDEELWEKTLSAKSEQLINSNRDFRSVNNDKTRLIRYYLPHNRMIKVFDQATKRSRYMSLLLKISS